MTNNDLVYLKTNLVIEPLWDQWYAWPHLISPATAALNLQGRHLKIMDSFIMAPKSHEQAVKNPQLLGGPFMDIAPEFVNEVQTLKVETLEKRKDLIEFAQAIKTLNTLLIKEGNGASLEQLYKKIPKILKGYVELVYDLNNYPSFRLFEALLFKSRFCAQDAQSIALWLTSNDERPFVLSTPRIKGNNNLVHLPIPFKYEAIDLLAQMKRHPNSLKKIKELLNITPEQETLFTSFFTSEKPKPYEPYMGNKIRMRYFGHACILIETKELSILIDPVISYYGYPTEVGRYSDMDLPEKIDYVLITHNHQDHILFETLLPLRHKIKHIVVPATTNGALQDPNLKLMFKAIGFPNVIQIQELETIEFEDCTITGIPFLGEHSDLNIHSKICHHLKIGHFSMLFAADSCNIEPQLYYHIQSITGDIDVLFLGMECDGAPLSWLYGPLQFERLPREKDHSRKLSGSDFEKGLSLVDALNPSEVYVYAMGQEPWLEYISSIKYTDESRPIKESNKLIEVCRKQGRIAERLFGEKEILYDKK